MCETVQAHPWLKDLLVQLTGVFAGAYLAFLFERKREDQKLKRELLNHLDLILFDLKKGIITLEGNIELLKSSARPRAFSLLPETYFGNVNWVAMRQLLGEESTELMRNVSQYIIPSWQQNVQQYFDHVIDGPGLIEIAQYYIGGYKKTTASIESRLRILK